ncbi:MAG: nucleotidyltransferase domain-containing protein [Tindallia sp. MSAO_Bac2]|nr:MAG: nucleotidyltransferase domain-containing protein [Tindallia sp. MSAO_Bac2]
MIKGREMEEIIQHLVPILKKYGVKKAILFGSYAKGEATNASDIDLLVDSRLRGLQFVGLMEDIRRAVNKEVDVLDVTHIEKDSKIDHEISKEGVVIYEEQDYPH